MSKLTIQRGAVGGAAGGASLDAITAAAADQAGILNADWNIAWKWAKVVNTEVAMHITESAAATNGTSTSGVPNQVLAKFSTLAASTMSPLSVYSRGNHIFSVSPSTTQILAAAGTAAAPVYSFAAAANAGMGIVSTPVAGLGLTHSGAVGLVVTGNTRVSVPAGSASAIGLSDLTNQVFGLAWNVGAVASVSFLDNTSPNIRPFEVITDRTATGTNIMYQAGATTTGALLDFKKARGSTAAPTVITTGDDLAKLSGYGYVGATNAYQEACRITFHSTGTISDSTTGIAGTIDFLTADTGSEPTSRFTISNKGELLVAGSAGTSGQILTSGGSGAAPSWATAGGGGFDPTTTVEIMEEFIGGVNTTGQMFTHGWRFTGSGSIVGLQGIANKPGILQLGSGTTAAAGTTVELRNIESNGLFVGGQGNLTAIYSAATPVSHADATYRIGLSGQGSSAGENESQILFRAIGTGNWYAVTSSGAGTTTTDTGVAQSTSYKQFKTVMNSAGTSVVFYIDGASVATHTTHIPTGNLVPKVQVQTASTTAYYIYADYFYVKITGLSR